MKKTTIAVAALLTALSSASVLSVAYADDTTTAPTTKSDTCKGNSNSSCKGTCNGCKGSTTCKGGSSCNGCKGSTGTNQ